MSLDFDGSNDVVSRASFQPATPVVVLAWFNADDQGEGDAGMLVGHGDNATEERLAIAWNGTASSEKLRILIGTDGTDAIWDMTTGFAAVTGWKAILVSATQDGVGTSHGATLYTYVDGVMSAALTPGSGLTVVASPTGTIRANNETLRIGCNAAGAQAWNGKIGEVAIWTNFVLTAAAAASIFTLGALAPYVDGLGGGSALYAYWPMDDTGAAQALDYSGNGRDGTISGAILGSNPPIRPCGRTG